ncbi:efflux RND transporter periplasmic adaptor subunit [Stieleria varia]|uniref:Cobalt-zinc-cadmium resistance protein CzcB n=1 Tax=Stieleria varia TaxID=2528005 RepID=A0A5C6B105_9BACT|nr:efflux RND transporter periplasmic adaptor subunit [Stieleria varia]TWU05082.1 Cobalt-zinc-cadmium resistance protein CzcB [Stieleria varia]
MSEAKVLEQPVTSPQPISAIPLSREQPPSDLPSDALPTRLGIVDRARGFVFGWMPSVLVVAVLAGMAWFGHQNDWKLPKFSSVAEDVANADPAWCDSHGVPEEACIVCQPGLIEDAAELTFCREHGVHGCVLCHPRLAETKQPTEPTTSDLARAERALMLTHRKENIAVSSTPGTRIQFASLEAMTKAGVDVEPVERRAITEEITAAGEIRYDETKTAQVSPQIDGIVRRAMVQVGDWVKAGDVMAVIDSQEAGRLKTALLSALLYEQLKQDQHDRVAKLAPSGAISGSRVMEAKTELRQANANVEQAIRAFTNLGLHVDIERLRGEDLAKAKAIIRSIGADHIKDVEDSDNLVAVTAPIEGRVVDRLATIGQVVDRGSNIFRIVDTRAVWLDLRVAAEQASLVRIGQTVRYLPDGQTTTHEGRVSWISTDVDPQTRTVRVRTELSNTDESLRNESFGAGQIVLREESDAIVVPESSLQWDGTGHVVFVRDARFFEKNRPKFFVARSVRPGVRRDKFVEIIAGVLPGEVVASSGSDVLRAQLLKSNLGAGCTCGH